MTIKELAKKLTQFESTHERLEEIEACLDFCADFFRDMPVDIKKYKKEGIPSLMIQTHNTLKKDIILLGHIDTVPGDKELFAGKTEGGRLYGRGTLDMKAFVATSMIVMKELIEEGYEGNIGLAIVSDEELGGLYGANYLVNEIGYVGNTVLVPDDGEQITKMVTGTKHVFHIELKASGKEAHGCLPWEGDNAIDALIRTYSNLRKYLPELRQTPEDQWVNTMNLGKISGGSATNEVAKDATMHIDIRITETTKKEEVLEWIKAALENGVSHKVVMEGYPTIVEPNDPVIQAYAKEIEQVTKEKPTYIKSGGATDGRYFAQKGMRVIVHQGTGGNCQAEDEYVELDSLEQLIQIQKNFIKKIS